MYEAAAQALFLLDGLHGRVSRGTTSLLPSFGRLVDVLQVLLGLLLLLREQEETAQGHTLLCPHLHL